MTESLPAQTADKLLQHCKLRVVKPAFRRETLVHAPCMHGCYSQFAMMGGWNIVAGNVEEVCNRGADGHEALTLLRRLEARHDPLLSLDELMGILRSILQSPMRKMFDAGHDLPLGGAIGA